MKASTHDFLSLYDKGSHQVENGSSAGMSQLVLSLYVLSVGERAEFAEKSGVFVVWFLVSQ